jgi:hypothetical protein
MHVSLAFVRNGTSYQKRIISHPFANRNVVYKTALRDHQQAPKVLSGLDLSKYTSTGILDSAIEGRWRSVFTPQG